MNRTLPRFGEIPQQDRPTVSGLVFAVALAGFLLGKYSAPGKVLVPSIGTLGLTFVAFKFFDMVWPTSQNQVGATAPIYLPVPGGPS